MKLQTTVLQADGDIPNWLQDPIAEIITALPRVVGALLILLVGWVVGAALGRVVRRLSDRVGVDRRTRETPIGRMLGDTPGAVSNALGTIAAWFVYALAILAAANALAIPELSRWISRAVSYIPAFIAGLAVIILGFVLADFVGDAIERTRAATDTAYTTWFADGLRFFLYFVVLVIGLDTMGVDVSILYLFARAMAWGLAAGVALAIGIAFGWGGHDYVAENIGDWMGRARRGTPSPSSRTSGSETGTSSEPTED